MNLPNKYVIVFIIISVLTIQNNAQSLIIHNTIYEHNNLTPNSAITFPINVTSSENDPCITNAIYNGNFTDYDNNNPNGFYSSGSSYTYDDNQYTAIVHGGSKSYSMFTQGLQFPTTANTYIYFNNMYINNSIILNSWFYGYSPKFSSSSYMYFNLYGYSSSGYHSVSYYFLYQNEFSYQVNGTSNAYILSNKTAETWFNINLNVSDIFYNAFSNIDDLYIYYIQFSISSDSNSNSATQLVIDDFTISNKTGDIIYNQDFETSNNWAISGNSNPAYLSPLDGGGANITLSLNDTYNSYSSLNLQKGWSGGNAISIFENYSNFKMKWNIDFPSGISSYSYLSLRFSNQTSYVTLSFILNNVDSNFENYTSSYSHYYFNATNINKQNQWNLLSIDLSSKLKQLGYSNHYLSYMQLYSYINGIGNDFAHIKIKYLDMQAPPMVDPGFEDISGYSDVTQIYNYQSSTSGTPLYSRVTEAHSGKYALNTSLTAGDSLEVYRYSSKIEITQDVYTDFWWRMDEINISTNDMIAFRLTFSNYQLNYIITGSTSDPTFSNTSYSVTYNLNITNKLKTWVNLQRNILNDLNSAFGNQTWTLDTVRIKLQDTTTNSIKVLFDDLNFIKDTSAPILYSLSIQNDPVYYSPTTLIFTANDSLSTISNATVYYKFYSEWMSIKVSGNWEYTLSIPEYAYNTEVEFYIYLEDIIGNSVIYKNDNGNYFSYTIDDDVSPILSIKQPYNNSIISGTVLFNITAIDVASGISTINLLIDNETLENISQTSYILNSRDFTNGAHILSLEGYDNAHNVGYSQNYRIIFDNDFEGPLISDPLLTPIIAKTPVNASVSVSDESGIQEVNAYVRIDTGSWVELSMEQVGNSGGLYTTSFPAIDEGSTLYYYIVAVDKYNQSGFLGSETSPYSYSLDLLNTSQPTGLDSVINEVNEIYENYSFYLGAASMAMIYLIGKIIVMKLKKVKNK